MTSANAMFRRLRKTIDGYLDALTLGDLEELLAELMRRRAERQATALRRLDSEAADVSNPPGSTT